MPIAQRDPWALAKSIAQAAPQWSQAMWLHKYLHIVIPSALGNIRPAMIRLFGLEIPGSGRFGLPVIDGLPASIAIDAHIGNLLSGFSALSWVPPLQRWSIVRSRFRRQHNFLPQGFEMVGETLSVISKEAGDLRVERPPRRGTDRSVLRTLSDLRLARQIWSFFPTVRLQP